MCLLITVFAAITATVVWYKNNNPDMLIGRLALIFWGASLMWLVDAIAEYIELGAEYFNPAPADMLNDAFLGLSVAALGLIIWLVMLLVKDPKGTLRAALTGKNKNS
ncbi:MAG: hypothetical protein J1F63_08140 [Oscillospiraceae bacterium]|nr:hypothetical protein [Oscillospiraceae bacterium]